MTARPAHLRPVPGTPTGRIQLTAWQRMEVEAARQMVAETLAGPDPKLADLGAAFLAGVLAGKVANLLDILDAITEVS